MSVPYRHLDRAELDRQLSPSLSAKDAMGVLDRHVAETASLWTAPGLETVRDMAYGPTARERVDIIRPEGPGPFPCLAFIHGGFWQEGAKEGSGFAARALADAGWATALIGYTLAPEARLSQIVAQIGRALDHLHANAGALRLDPARIVVAGHSAGGHLAAAILCGKAGAETARIPAGAILISGVYDLAPIAASYVNDKVGMDPAEVAALSLLDAPRLNPAPVAAVVGGDEPEAFLAQTRALAEAWGIETRIVPGRDHFDILDELGAMETIWPAGLV